MSRLAPIFVIVVTLTALCFIGYRLLAPAGQYSPPESGPNSVEKDESPSNIVVSGAPIPAAAPAPYSLPALPSAAASLPLNTQAARLRPSGFGELPAPALLVDSSGSVSAPIVTMPVVFVAEVSGMHLSPAQRAEISALADAFAVNAGEPPPPGTPDSDPRHTAFAISANRAGNEADFLFKQRYGHHAFVRMQMEAAALASP